jgi:hypothetical protein
VSSYENYTIYLMIGTIGRKEEVKSNNELAMNNEE